MNEPLAIIGIGCRFPGSADSPEAFWQLLCAGVDAITEIPADRWSIAAFYDPRPGLPGKSCSRWGGFLAQIDGFDPAFFGISAREADAMDPQQRLLLEASWHAFEDAGQPLEVVRASRTGVFVGISTTDYAALQTEGDGRFPADAYSATGCSLSIAANRVSYCFDLRGPSLAIDTACSSALSACHLAARSLARGECTQAIVAGVNALLSPANFIAFSRMGMLSPVGRCKAFDATADGFVRAEGVGAVLLKPLSAARADGDRIYALLLATATNEDGHTASITLPSASAQARLIREACASAGIEPAQIDYVEAHGTGTAAGDPIEAAALGEVLRQRRKAPCPIGSVKTNLGHLEAAAGIASLIKVALLLHHRVIPPSLHCDTPNPAIDFAALKLRVVRELEPLPKPAGRREIAAVNAFGFGGANAHALLSSAEALPAAQAARAQSATVSPPVSARAPVPALVPLLLTISAHSAAALQALAGAYRDLLAGRESAAASVCAAAALYRSALPHRLSIVAADGAELRALLTGHLDGSADVRIATGECAGTPAIAWMFSGQGPQWWGMGRGLLAEQPVFREMIEACDALLQEFGGWSLLEQMRCSEADSRLTDTALAQPALFALQVALAALWRHWGLAPAAVIGHSVGEVAAAHVAGILSLREAARIVTHRARCMGLVPQGGGMLAAALSSADRAAWIDAHPGIELAAINAPDAVTLAGDSAALARLAAALAQQGRFQRMLQVSHAFHSAQMDPVRAPLLAALGTVRTQPARCRFVSTVTGGELTETLDVGYWWRNVRSPVRFDEAVRVAAEHAQVFLEIGPHPVLGAFVRGTLRSLERPANVIACMRRDEPESLTLRAALSALYAAGAPIAWRGVYSDASRSVSLPRYPWQRQRHWRESELMRAGRLQAPAHPLLGVRTGDSLPTWRVGLDLQQLRWLADHRVREQVIFPGAGYVEAAMAAARAQWPGAALQLQDVEFLRALPLSSAHDTVQLETRLDPLERRIELRSRELAAPTMSTTSTAPVAWSLHARCRVGTHGLAPPRHPLAQLRRRLRARLDHDSIYRALAHCGLHYGPSFRRLVRGRYRDGEALCVLQPTAVGDGGFDLHPTVLDACLQVALLAAGVPRAARTWLPVRIDRVRRFPGKAAIAYVYARARQMTAFARSFDLAALDRAGRTLLEIEGLQAQALRAAGADAADAASADPSTWLYEPRWIADECAPEPLALSGTWAVLTRPDALSAQLIARLRAGGARPVLIHPSDSKLRRNHDICCLAAGAQPDLPALLARACALTGAPLVGVIYLADVPTMRATAAATPTRRTPIGSTPDIHQPELLALVSSAAGGGVAAPIWIVTRGAQAVSGAEDVDVTQALAVGLARTLASERGDARCRLVDLPMAQPAHAVQCLIRELGIHDGESEVAWRHARRWLCRLESRPAAQLRAPIDARHPPAYRLEIPASHILDDLAARRLTRRAPAADEVEIEIVASGVNFRDGMKVIGAYPLNADSDLLLGDECSGRVVARGGNVRGLRIGAEVIAIGAGCLASHVTVPAALVARKPSRLSFAQAAALPVAYLTAWHALHEVAHLARGESVLVHAATGGVGLAAVHVAQRAGATVWATAGTPAKRAYLRRLGVRGVLDSRSTDFAARLRQLTRGRGVDVILNSLAGEALIEGLSLLAPGGRFLEIGKRDVYADTRVGLRALRHNASLHVIDLWAVLAQAPTVTGHLLRQMVQRVRRAELPTLPCSGQPLSRAPDTLRCMLQGQHRGKLVLTAERAPSCLQDRAVDRRCEFAAHATYLVTGGLGGFGLALAEWLIDRGARHLVLCGRSGAATAVVRRSLARLRRAGARIEVERLDVANALAVSALVTKLAHRRAPLRGIFHAAAVLDDALLTDLSAARLRRVWAPKALGAWNLHLATRALRLDHFVLFSSISGVLGAAGQGSYAAANCALDAIAQHRRSQGLPALSINWGPVALGMLARDPRTAQRLEAQGLLALTAAQALQLLGWLLMSDAGQRVAAHVDWRRLRAARAASTPKFAALGAPDGGLPPGTPGLPQRLLAARGPERTARVLEAVRETIGGLLRLPATRLDARRSLHELGLDSLMALELLNRLQSQFGVPVPSSALSAATTIGALGAQIVALLSARLEPPPQVPGGVLETARAQQCVPLRSGSGDRALFLVHPAGGGLAVYAPLVGSLPGSAAVYGVRSRCLAGASAECASLDELVNSYAALIQTQQPSGPVRLAGFSVGGLLALATASALERAGRTVAGVALFDAPLAALDAERPDPLWLTELIGEIYAFLCGELALTREADARHWHAIAAATAEQLASDAIEARQTQAILDGLRRGGVELAPAELARVRELLQLAVRHVQLIRGARLDAIRAPVYLWLASSSSARGSGGCTRALSTRKVQSREITATHFELLRAPHVARLAAELAVRLLE